METLNQVEIDSLGRFGYVMIKVLDKKTNNTRIIIRGSQSVDYHIGLVDEFERILKQHRMNNLEFSCLGGGRIIHNPYLRFIKVHGTSAFYGQADHEETVRIIKNSYKNYEVTWPGEKKKKESCEPDI